MLVYLLSHWIVAAAATTTKYFSCSLLKWKKIPHVSWENQLSTGPRIEVIKQDFQKYVYFDISHSCISPSVSCQESTVFHGVFGVFVLPEELAAAAVLRTLSEQVGADNEMNRTDCVNSEMCKAAWNFWVVVSPLFFLGVFIGAVRCVTGTALRVRLPPLVHLITTLSCRPRGSCWKQSPGHLSST